MDLERVVEENKGLVYKVASEFHVEQEYFQELLQVGYIALIDAYRRFNAGFGYRFSTYAVYYIKGYMMKYIKNFTYNRMIRIPEHVFANMEKLREYSYQVSSFESPLQKGSDLRLGDTLFAEDEIEKKEYVTSMQKILSELFEVLTLREQLVLELRYYEDMTLQEIAHTMNLTRERIRQIEAKAFLKMRRKAVKIYGKDYKKLDIFN